VSDDYSSDDEEVRQMKKARRRAKRKASRGRSVMWTVLLVLLVSVLVAFVYKPVAIGGGDGAEWQDALAELSASALNTVQRLRQEFSAGDL
jgi:cytoskeletal protein RodZ